MSKALLSVDSANQQGKVSNNTSTFVSLEEAQRESVELSQVWSDCGFVKVHECWIHPSTGEWRQKIIVWQGVEWTEEDGEDE